jgi:hypothetical protein
MRAASRRDGDGDACAINTIDDQSIDNPRHARDRDARAARRDDARCRDD